MRGDLVETLGRRQERADRLDGILIGTTGLADPAPVASTFLEKNLAQSDEAMEQVAFSDIVLINKMDLVSSEQMDRIERRVRQINPLARIALTARCQ